jgi:hypothetical protein
MRGLNHNIYNVKIDQETLHDPRLFGHQLLSRVPADSGEQINPPEGIGIVNGTIARKCEKPLRVEMRNTAISPNVNI